MSVYPSHICIIHTSTRIYNPSQADKITNEITLYRRYGVLDKAVSFFPKGK
jgi:hypothetical protein